MPRKLPLSHNLVIDQVVADQGATLELGTVTYDYVDPSDACIEPTGHQWGRFYCVNCGNPRVLS